MRICLYTETALPKIGGQEMVVDILAKQFQDLSHEVAVLAPQPRLPLRPKDSQLPYRVVRHPRFFSSRFFVNWYRGWLLRLQQRFKFDVLHCHGIYPPGYLAALTKAQLGAPVVVTSHGGDVREGAIRLSKPIVRKRQEQALQSADALVAISRVTEQGYLRQGAAPAKIVRIPNGVNLESFLTPAPRPPDLDAAIQPKQYALFLGRLKYRKGVDLAMDSFSRLADASGMKLVIAGAGEERPGFEELARRLGVEHRVRFVGPVFDEKKTYLLQNAVCTVLPSRSWEAFPLVLLESCAASTPVIGTRVPGLEDLIKPEETGWLVEPGSAESLAEALREALSNPVVCTALGTQALRFARQHSWRRIAFRHLQLYQQLVNSSIRRRAV